MITWCFYMVKCEDMVDDGHERFMVVDDSKTITSTHWYISDDCGSDTWVDGL